MISEELLKYYAGDEFSASTWKGKYAYKAEVTPDDMHSRMANELDRIDIAMRGYGFSSSPFNDKLSVFGNHMQYRPSCAHDYLNKYRYIIPQGSIMTILGTPTIGSLSNCFVIPSPVDSYGGIFHTDQQIAQLEKRRGGVGLNINTLRPDGDNVANVAGTSTGAHSFMDRFSNTTREVAQNGRRGALMLLIDCRHPDVFKFVKKKEDLTKVTGANVSVMLTDKFMDAVMKNEKFNCFFPINDKSVPFEYEFAARELYDLIVEMAWKNGEPGVAFIDRITEYSPEGVYKRYKAIASNPCGEQWMNAYDACRLLAANLYSLVRDPFTKSARFDSKLAYEIFYTQQRMADNIVTLELEYINRIIVKIKSDPEPDHIKATELDLWNNILNTAKASRRTGCGFTALADMLAALGLKYDSDEALDIVEKLMRIKFEAELDCTIDLAILRGTFEGWDKDLEFTRNSDGILVGNNDFYKMVAREFPVQAERMYKYGRRNVSWSTVAPTGTVSIVARLDKYSNTSAGVEPQFSCFYFRNKKVNPSDKNMRVDFTDQNGDSWMTYPIIMGGFKEWIEKNHSSVVVLGFDNLPKEVIQELFEKSPYFGSCANDIDWEKRVRLQAIVQKYTTNAISSTLNLPNNVEKSVIAGIYQKAWELGLKGVTVYRDGCRTGVLNLEKKDDNKFDYTDGAKRPKEIDAELHIVRVKGIKYGVVIGMIDNKPYELFAFNAEESIKSCVGKTIKLKKGSYQFVCKEFTINNLQEIAVRHDEQVLTRLISGMLRHGAKPQFVMEQIDKCELEIVSFGKAISRVLKTYCSETELVKRSTCSNCGSSNLRMQEGCMTCLDCSSSKCG